MRTATSSERPQAPAASVAAAVALLKNAQRPLLITGKGAAYSGAEKEVQHLANSPFQHVHFASSQGFQHEAAGNKCKSRLAAGEQSISLFLQLPSERFGLPVLGTSMGRGLLPDNHPLCVNAARSMALAISDVAIVVGARLNW
eukprot:1158970-Pelagomonas_calceolata.AAC.2